MPFIPDKKDSFVPDGPAQPEGYLMNLWHKATTQNLENAPGYDLLAQAARLGQAGNAANQQMAGASAEQLGRMGVNKYVAAIPGTVYGTLSEANPFLPQNRLAAALALVQPAVKAYQAGKGALGLGSGTPSGMPAAAPLSAASEDLGNAPPSPGNQATLPAGVGASSIPTIAPEQQIVKAQADNLLVKEAQARGMKPDENFARKLVSYYHNQINELSDQIDSEFGKLKTPAEKEAFNNQLDTNPTVAKMRELQGKSNSVIAGYRDVTDKIPQGLEEKSKLLEGMEPGAAPKAGVNVKPNKPGALAQLISARTKVLPTEVQYALDNPNILDNAPSVKQATDEYVQSLGGLKNKTKALSEQLNKTIIRSGDYDEAINRAGRLIKGTPLESDPEQALTPQSALTGLQSINQAMRDKMYTKGMDPGQLKGIMELKDGLLDYLVNNGRPAVRAAGRKLFEAHVAEDLSQWVPKNKYGSPDALRTMCGMNGFGTGAAEAAAAVAMGHPGAALLGAGMMGNAALTSPRVGGQLIRELGAIRNPAVWQKANQMSVPLANALGGQNASGQ